MGGEIDITMSKPTKTNLGIDENIEAALCYLFGAFSGVFFLFMEKDNEFVKFHSIQSILFFITVFVVNTVMGFVFPYFFWMLFTLIYLLELFLWFWLMWNAYSRNTIKLPIIGDFAEKEVNKGVN